MKLSNERLKDEDRGVLLMRITTKIHHHKEATRIWKLKDLISGEPSRDLVGRVD